MNLKIGSQKKRTRQPWTAKDRWLPSAEDELPTDCSSVVTALAFSAHSPHQGPASPIRGLGGGMRAQARQVNAYSEFFSATLST